MRKIAVTVDGTKPEGQSWHIELLKQMSIEINQIRPAVISRETRNCLEEYRGFRHVVRNIYTFNLSPEKMKDLVENIDDLFARLKDELEALLIF